MQPVSSFNFIALIPVIVGLFFMVIGGVFIVSGARSRKQAESAQEWPSAAGRILSTDIHERVQSAGETGPRRTYEPVVEYEFSLMGAPMRGNRLSFGHKRFNTRRKAEAVLGQYQPGAIITVYYDPQDPSQSVLEREASGSMTYLVMGIIFLVLGLGMACVMGGAMSFLFSFAQ